MFDQPNEVSSDYELLLATYPIVIKLTSTTPQRQLLQPSQDVTIAERVYVWVVIMRVVKRRQGTLDCTVSLQTLHSGN
jgi:hypothetical protein